jgi:hypothetical protein
MNHYYSFEALNGKTYYYYLSHGPNVYWTGKPDRFLGTGGIIYSWLLGI